MSGLARQDTLGQEDGCYFRVEALVCSETLECLEEEENQHLAHCGAQYPHSQFTFLCVFLH